MKTIETIRIALVGVSHWHVPLYVRATTLQRLNIAAVSDPDERKARMLARQLDCACYTEEDRLFEEVRPEFVFAFAPHDRMPALAMKLIQRRIPFTIEKPLGLQANDVEMVEKAADEAGVFCAIPFVWRYSSLLQEFRQEVASSELLHLAFKFIAGPVSRYETTSPWMLQTERAGGGCMTNLGVHFIDMAMFLTGSDQAEVLAAAYHYASSYDIETYGTSLLRLSSGATLLLETGYAYPMDEELRDNRWNIVTKDGYYTLGDNCFEKRVFGRRTEKIPMSTDSDVYYADFVLESLRQYLAGERPRAGLAQMRRVRGILDAINHRAVVSSSL